MDVLASVLGAVLVETGRLLCCSISHKIKSIRRFQSNLDNLRKEVESLMNLKNSVKEQLELAAKDGNLPTPQVEDWLRQVEEIEIGVNRIQADVLANAGENLYACCSICRLRCRVGTEVAKILKDVEQLLKVGCFPSGMVVVNDLAKQVEHIPGPSIVGQTTASKNLATVLNLLNDDGVRRIGVWGMGGVGKTTLVKNLNNKLRSTSLTQPFGIIVWATVSKQLDLKRVQTQIAEKLNLGMRMDESSERVAIRLFQKLEKENKFLLILDDVWEGINLDDLGIPQPEVHTGCKIILTSRFLGVCREMKTDAQVKVDVLNDDEAWELFTQNAGKMANLEHIKPFAEAVTRECNGLPLAIITMGTSMRGKAMVELWKDALSALQRSVPHIKGIENKVYLPLKWSYDSLQGKDIKSCFLYCSLFPEDFSIEVSELVQCWLAEGLLDEHQNYEELLNRGIAITEDLKDSCLLEHDAHKGTVKMHDVVRDVAIWIASSLEDECKSLVQSGIGLCQIPEVELLKSFKNISFMNNKIMRLPDRVIQCSKASTLLLQGNIPLKIVPEGFLLGFQALRVLNVSGSHIKSLPLSLLQLEELRALLLRDCIYLNSLPPLGGLHRLQVLDLCNSGIIELPNWIEELRNLRQLNLSWTQFLKSIQAGIVSGLSGLEFLDMTMSAYKWGVQGEVKEGQATFEELGCLERLIILYIRLKGIPFFASKDLTWIKRLKRFGFFIGPFPDVNFLPFTHDERGVVLSGLHLSGANIAWLLVSASSLLVIRCYELSQMLENFTINSVGSFAGLKSLTIAGCDDFGPIRECGAKHDLLPNLEELHLYNLRRLRSLSEFVSTLGLKFSRLKLIEVNNCLGFTYLISFDLILNLRNLEEIKVTLCDNFDSLFQCNSWQTVAPDPVVPNLRILKLENLPKLRIICREKESWQSLEQLEVINCDLLRKIPLNMQNANTIKEIRGERQWWSKLEWDDADIKLSLQPYFKPVGDRTTLEDLDEP